MSEPLPNQHYYRRCHGHWRTQLDLRITNWTAFRQTSMTVFDRLSFVMMVFLPRVIGPLWLETSVDAAPGGSEMSVVHTTAVKKWGRPLFRSLETIDLSPDGESLSLEGEQRVWPFLGSARVVRGQARVDPSGRRVTYQLEWFGGVLEQQGEVEEDQVTLTQASAWSHGVQRLRRRTGARRD